MKGPEAKRARPLAERFADLESRIQGLEAKAQATPGEHTVADMINDLRNRRDVVRRHLARSDTEGSEAHFAARGTAATSASTKETDDEHEGEVPRDPSNTSNNVRATSDRTDQEAEAAYRDLEEAYERALTRFR